jgi:hypothetical protein
MIIIEILISQTTLHLFRKIKVLTVQMCCSSTSIVEKESVVGVSFLSVLHCLFVSHFNNFFLKSFYPNLCFLQKYPKVVSCGKLKIKENPTKKEELQAGASLSALHPLTRRSPRQRLIEIQRLRLIKALGPRLASPHLEHLSTA